MDIVKEDVNELNAILKLKVKESDYKEKVTEVLKSYKKKANVPGFRPGKVPVGMLNKMYGASVKADEINKLLNDAIYNYIDTNKLQILGNPLPKEDTPVTDFESKSDFEFAYELGLSPKFEVNLSNKNKFTNYLIKVDDALMNKNLDDIKKRYGKLKESNIVGENDMVVVDLTELGKENGIVKQSTIYTEYIEDSSSKKSIIGLNIGDTTQVNIRKLAKDEANLATMLGVTKDELSAISKKFDLKVVSTQTIIPADENQELYDKIFGPGKIKNKEEFESKSREELVKVLDGFSDRKLKKDVMDAFIKKLKLSLPDEFLKKWLKATNKEVSEDQVDKEYEKFGTDMRWMLVENQIVKENNIELPYEELQQAAEKSIIAQFSQYGLPAPEKEQLDQYVSNILSNKEESQKLRGELMDKKILSLFRETLTLKNKEVTYSEFEDILQEKTSRFNIFKKLKF